MADDRRSIATLPQGLTAKDRDERTAFAVAALGPWRGIGADGEIDWLREAVRYIPSVPQIQYQPHDGHGLRAGLRAEQSRGSWTAWGQLYRIRTSLHFEPYYSALTYDPNRQGWRASGGIKFFPAGRTRRERAGVTAFYRRTRQTDLDSTQPSDGRVRSTVADLTFYGRPHPLALGEIHLIRTEDVYPAPADAGTKKPDIRTDGISFDAHYEGWNAVDPSLRFDAIRRQGEGVPRHAIWQGMFSVRVLS